MCKLSFTICLHQEGNSCPPQKYYKLIKMSVKGSWWSSINTEIPHWNTTGWDSKLQWELLKNPLEAMKNIKNVYVATSGSFQLANCRCSQSLYTTTEKYIIILFSIFMQNCVLTYRVLCLFFIPMLVSEISTSIKQTITPFIILRTNTKEKLNPLISALKIENTQKTKPKKKNQTESS